MGRFDIACIGHVTGGAGTGPGNRCRPPTVDPSGTSSTDRLQRGKMVPCLDSLFQTAGHTADMPAGYAEDLEPLSNVEIEPKNFFEMA